MHPPIHSNPRPWQEKMRDALTYPDEQETAGQGKKSPKGINFIHKVMGMLPGQKDVEEDKYAQVYKKSDLQSRNMSFQVLNNLQNFHYKNQQQNH